MSMNIVIRMTKIKFWPKDDNVGFSRNTLSQLHELSVAHNVGGLDLVMNGSWEKDEPYCVYTMHTVNDTSLSHSEIKEVIEGIKEICKGVELVFKVYNTVPEEHTFMTIGITHEVPIEEIYAPAKEQL